MRDIRSCSGPWNGIWQQGPVRGMMNFELRFDDVKCSGGGTDRDGSFSIAGIYDPRTEALTLLKSYGELLVRYSGTWNGSFVAGDSQIFSLGFMDSGQFEIWPESESQSLNLSVESETLIISGS